MGFRYRKSFRIVPGIRINLSKRGFSSVSIGGRGATVNFGRTGIRQTIGVPGTGVSYSWQSRYSRPKQLLPPPVRLIGPIVGGTRAFFVSAANGHRSAQLVVAVLTLMALSLYITSRVRTTGPIESAQSLVVSLAAPVSTSKAFKAADQKSAATTSTNDILAHPLRPIASTEKPPVSSLSQPALRIESPPTPGPKSQAIAHEHAVSTTKSALVRAAPSKDALVVKHLLRHAALAAIDTSGDWVKVRDRGTADALGWVNKSLLKMPDQ